MTTGPWSRFTFVPAPRKRNGRAQKGPRARPRSSRRNRRIDRSRAQVDSLRKIATAGWLNVLGSPAVTRANGGWRIVAGGGAWAAAAGPTAPTMATTSRHQHRGNQEQSSRGDAQLHGIHSFSGARNAASAEAPSRGPDRTASRRLRAKYARCIFGRCRFS